MKVKKLAAAAAMFAAVLNMNGCVYGPPPQDAENGFADTDKGAYQTEDTTLSANIDNGESNDG
ncbi:MAG: hypothetical protein IJZ95_05025 [Oscillospiraceae bacterium]|nr:hypothetical protein [Oscillospiraceae bacterium]